MSGYSEKELLDAGMIEITDEKCEQILDGLDKALMKSQTKVNPFTPADHKEFNFGKFM